jgi:hypothetical protein
MPMNNWSSPGRPSACLSAPKRKGAYNAEKMDGLPVGAQVAARPWDEEKVLGHDEDSGGACK